MEGRKESSFPSSDNKKCKEVCETCPKLAYRINCFIAEKGLTQKEAASFLGISRAKMTALRNGRLNTFSIDLLFALLGKLDHHIEIRVIPKETSHTEETITVAVV